MASLTTRQAASRLHALDTRQPDRNAPDLLLAASGGYGKAKQDKLLEDIRTLYAYVLGERSVTPEPTSGFDAA